MMAKGEIEEEAGIEFLDKSHERLAQYPPTKVIYLYSNPENTISRLLGRGRPQESGQTLMNIAELEQAHQMLLPIICEEIGVELVEVDWSEFGNIKKIINLI